MKLLLLKAQHGQRANGPHALSVAVLVYVKGKLLLFESQLFLFCFRAITCTFNDQKIEDKHCNQYRPVSEESCNLEPCPSWSYSNWGPCSATCGGGKRKRQVRCELNGSKVSDSNCEIASKSEIIESCSSHECPRWSIGSWGSCSKSCDGGDKKR